MRKYNDFILIMQHEGQKKQSMRKNRELLRIGFAVKEKHVILPLYMV